jgi:DNA-directed RNA polymerase subunit M/transcription elongation factor TFIIS
MNYKCPNCGSINVYYDDKYEDCLCCRNCGYEDYSSAFEEFM